MRKEKVILTIMLVMKMSENLVKVLAAQVEAMRRDMYSLMDNLSMESDRITALQFRIFDLEKKIKNEM